MAEIDIDHPWKEPVETVLAEVRPALEMHGGGATFLGVDGKTVLLKLHGACDGCPMSAMTFGVMVEDMIKEKIPEVERVVYEGVEA